VVIALALTGALIACAQDIQTRRNNPAINRPTCSRRAICFSGEVSAGEEFRKSINTELEFVLAPGWTITVVHKKPEGDCHEFASVVNALYRAHRDVYAATPRNYDEALEKLGTSPLGKDRFWITNSKITHAGDTPDRKTGRIEWMKFTVEIILPHR
jgi:hypothetical protein